MIEEIKIVSNRNHLIEDLCESIFPAIYGHDTLKKLAILQIVNLDKRENNINILVKGNLATAKTEMIKGLIKLFPQSLDRSLRNIKNESILDELESGRVIYLDDIEKMTKKQKREIEGCIEGNGYGSIRPIFAVCNKEELDYVGSKEFSEEFLTKFDFVIETKESEEPYANERTAVKILENKGPMRPIINPELAKNYILYAKQMTNPSLTEGAINEIKRFYAEIRQEIGVSRVNPRQIKSIAKLAVAYAKIRLHNEASMDDAKNAIRLFRLLYPKIEFKENMNKLMKKSITAMLIKHRAKHK